MANTSHLDIETLHRKLYNMNLISFSEGNLALPKDSSICIDCMASISQKINAKSQSLKADIELYREGLAEMKRDVDFIRSNAPAMQDELNQVGQIVKEVVLCYMAH